VAQNDRVSGLTLVAGHATERERPPNVPGESEERYRDLFETSHDAMFINTCDGRLIDFNQATLDLLGYPRDELSRINVTSLYVDPADRDRYRAEIERAGSVRDYEIRLRRKDGTKLDGLLTATVRRAKDGTVVGYQGCLRDVTERNRLQREMLEVGEREQRRIGQDLHDGLGQHLTGIAFLSKVLSEKLASRGLPEATDARKIESLINEAINQARSLAKGLQPVALGTGRLALALEEMCLHMTKLFGIPCSCQFTGEFPVDDGSLATNVYRIAQEAVSNAVKHSSARNIRVELHTAPRSATLLVQDNGVGIRPASDKTRGLGLHIMRYRAGMIGGSLEIVGERRRGTKVRCVFPIPGARGRVGAYDRSGPAQANPAS
jgi:PAS domain S-box-containing protein